MDEKKFYTDSDFFDLIAESLTLFSPRVSGFLDYHASRSVEPLKFWLLGLDKALTLFCTANDWHAPKEYLNKIGYRTHEYDTKTPQQIHDIFLWRHNQCVTLVHKARQPKQPAPKQSFLTDTVINNLFDLVGESLGDTPEMWAKRFVDDETQVEKFAKIAPQATPESNKRKLIIMLGIIDNANKEIGFGIRSFPNFAKSKFPIGNYSDLKNKYFASMDKDDYSETIKKILQNAK